MSLEVKNELIFSLLLLHGSLFSPDRVVKPSEGWQILSDISACVITLCCVWDIPVTCLRLKVTLSSLESKANFFYLPNEHHALKLQRLKLCSQPSASTLACITQAQPIKKTTWTQQQLILLMRFCIKIITISRFSKVGLSY